MSLELQVSEKGAVSLYGLNRFPFTLYAEEWRAVFGAGGVVRSYIARHHVSLSCRCSESRKEDVRLARERGEIPLIGRHEGLWCRNAQTGAVSLYGLRRFPVTLYCDQWLRVLDPQMREDVESFVRLNGSRLSTKGCSVPRVHAQLRVGVRTYVGPDNIIRPIAATTRQS